MTLPASGSITIAQIATELGVGLPLGLTDSNVRTLAGVPSGNIILPNDFWGKSNLTITAADYSTSNVSFSDYTLVNTGAITENGGVPVADWVSPTSEAANCEVYATYVGGAFNDAPAFDTWLSLGTTRAWQTFGNQTGLMTLQFRHNGGSVLKTISVTVSSTEF